MWEYSLQNQMMKKISTTLWYVLFEMILEMFHLLFRGMSMSRASSASEWREWKESVSNTTVQRSYLRSEQTRKALLRGRQGLFLNSAQRKNRRGEEEQMRASIHVRYVDIQN